jgi:hypothetical protein
MHFTRTSNVYFLDGVTLEFDSQGRCHIVLGARLARTSHPVCLLRAPLPRARRTLLADGPHAGWLSGEAASDPRPVMAALSPSGVNNLAFYLVRILDHMISAHSGQSVDGGSWAADLARLHTDLHHVFVEQSELEVSSAMDHDDDDYDDDDDEEGDGDGDGDEDNYQGEDDEDVSDDDGGTESDTTDTTDGRYSHEY